MAVASEFSERDMPSRNGASVPRRDMFTRATRRVAVVLVSIVLVAGAADLLELGWLPRPSALRATHRAISPFLSDWGLSAADSANRQDGAWLDMSPPPRSASFPHGENADGISAAQQSQGSAKEFSIAASPPIFAPPPPSIEARASGTEAAVGSASRPSSQGLLSELLHNKDLATCTERLVPPHHPSVGATYLDRGVVFRGDRSGAARLAAKLLAGEPVRMGALGGSVTFGRGASRPELAYAPRAFAWFNASFPHPESAFLNGGVAAANSEWAAACAQHDLPVDPDLVIVEFAINDGPAPWTHHHRRSYERLLRRLQELPSRPLVLPLMAFNTHQFQFAGVFYNTPEDAMGVLSQYYNLPWLSMRNVAFAERQGLASFWAGRPGSAQKEATWMSNDLVHPNDRGHGILADLVVHHVRAELLRHAADACRRGGEDVAAAREAARAKLRALEGRVLSKAPWRSNRSKAAQEGAVEESRPAAAAGRRLLQVDLLGARVSLPAVWLPPPMLPDLHSLEADACVLGAELEQYAEGPSSGFSFVYEGKERRAVSHLEGAELRLRLSTGPPPLGRDRTALGLLIGRGHGSMGNAWISCESGCRCERRFFRGLHRFMFATQEHLEYISVTPSDQCVLLIQAAYPTGPGRALRVRGFVTSRAAALHWPEDYDLGEDVPPAPPRGFLKLAPERAEGYEILRRSPSPPPALAPPSPLPPAPPARPPPPRGSGPAPRTAEVRS